MTRRKGYLSFQSGIAFIGIAIGVAILITVTSIMNGFERELKDRILQAIPHATIEGSITKEEVEDIRRNINLNDEVLGTAPFIETQGLVTSGDFLKGVYIYGVEPNMEKEVSSVSNHIVDGSWSSLNESSFNVVIGDILAIQLGLRVGDQINLLIPDTSLGLAGFLPKTKLFNVSAIFSLGAPEMDQSYVYMHIENASKLQRMDNFIHGIRIRYKDLFSAQDEIKEDFKRVSLKSSNTSSYTTWQSSYGTLFKAIKNEKFLIALLLFSIILISVNNVMSMIIMTINQKKAEISILMTLGASTYVIKKIFFFFGSIIGIFGTILGLILGLILTANFGTIVSGLESLFQVSFLEIYFINYFPVDIRLNWVLIISSISILLTLLSSLYPASLAAKVEPVEILKHE